MNKTFEELTIKDNFMFTAVMLDEENCKGLLERALDMKIDHVVVNKEKTLVYNPDFRSVRLDVYAANSEEVYDIEMQVDVERNIAKRSRYYHDEMSMDILEKSADYDALPNTYVIFVCDYDPFGDKLYRYSFNTVCKENGKELEDGRTTVFLSTMGENDTEISADLKNLLDYIGARSGATQDEFTDRLKSSVNDIKKRSEMRTRYMRFQELLDKERNEGIEVGRNTILDTYAWLKQNNRDADADMFMEHGNVEFRNKMIGEYREATGK